MEHRQYHGQGYTLRCIRTDKFKTFSIALRFAGAFLPETLNARALLPEVLMGGTKKHPTREALQSRMDGLYGLSVSVGTDKLGCQSVVFVDLKSIEGTYLPGGASTLPEALDLLREILFEPKMIQGTFRKKTVAEEVRLLKEDFEAEYADKTETAYHRFMNLMFENELHRYRSKGIYETLDALTPEEITKAYRDLLETDEVTILAVGNFDFDELAREIAARFRFGTHAETLRWLDLEQPEVLTPRKVVESGEVAQAKINVGYRFDVRFGDETYYAAAVTNAIFGEFDHSKLFQVVREQHTLCYYINSLYDSNKGFISVMAGTDPDKAEQALSLIAGVLASLQNGEITDEELLLAKESLSKRIRQNADSPDRLATLDFMYNQIFGFGYSTERSLSAIAGVTKEMVAAMSRRIYLDTTYVLTGRDPR